MTDHAELLPTESTPHRRPGSSPGRREPACLHELFEECAARTPSAVALSHGSVEVPYGELDRRAGRLARHLRGLGVGPECLVGLCSERSVETVVAILAVLKAGGAYLPLDPDYPEERIRFMWEDSRRIPPPGSPSVLLAPAGLAERLEPLAAATASRLVLLDEEAGDGVGDAGGTEASASRSSTRSSTRSLAYVIYTSGSTGRPKGVMIEHRGVVNVVRHAARVLRVERGSRVLQLASLSFDASVLEIFTALTSGARLILTPRETLLSGEALGEELRRRAIHTLAIPPSLLDRIPDGVELPALRSIVVGGEACSAATARRWAPGRVFVNAYAPTEATIYTTAGTCPGPFDRPPSMGRPIAGTAVRVLDEEGRPVPDGGIGELCLGGLGLARGYGGRAALTAERFVPTGPTGEGAELGSRLYRSGDLGRRLPDGSLEFAGRADHQVKVRGLRIELGEIEAHLVAFPGVRQAVVVRREDSPGEPRLVGYVVSDPGALPPVSELRSFLAERLPEAMVPSAFVILDGFPRTPTGKIDRRALPAPGPERPDLATAYAPPEGPLETALAAIWADLLGLERVGAEDNLFELGGHSLVVAQIVNRVRQELGLELPLLAPFEHPTVRGLAAHLASLVEGGRGEEAAAGDLAGPVASAAHRLPPLEPVPRDRPIPVSFPQERIWFLLQLAPRSIAYNFQFSLRFRGDLSVPALAQALGELVRRHEILRTTFPAEDGRPVQRIHPPFAARVPVVDLSRVADTEGGRRREGVLRELIRAEVRRGFDVTHLPLLRWTLFHLGPEDHLLLQVEHHFVHDGWSLAVYLRELEALYSAYRDGRPSPLPEPAAQYADFAAWQRRFMQGEALEEQLDHWRGKLAGSPPLLELPTDRPHPRAHSFRGGCLRVDLDPELYREVRSFSRGRSATLFMTMLAAFDALLHRYTGQDDILLGSGLANRRLRETEELVGMVVNTLVIRTSLHGALTFRELLERVRRTTLELHLYQDLPFEKLVERLQPDRDLSRNPLFQVLFSFHDAPVPDLDLPGLATELFEWHNGSAKTALNVVVKPVAEQRVGRRARAEDDVLTMVWEYSSDVFERTTIERMWGHYRNLLAGAVAAPEQPLSRLPLLSAAERHELLVERGGAVESHPREPSLPALFAAQARRRPEAVAVCQGERSWSYGELASRSRRLARNLRALGVGPDVPVGLCLDRSIDLVVGLLAVLEAGGAYVPLDPSYPPERLALTLGDALAGVASPVVVTRERFAPMVSGGGADGAPSRRLVLLDGEAGDQGAEAGEENPAPDEPAPDHLAYVIYTSGSTGRPKGVQVTHGNAVRLLHATRGWFDFGPDDLWTLFHSYAFDFSVWELWGALALGGRLALVSGDVARSPERFHELLVRERVTVLNQTPSAFRHLARLHGERGFPTLALRWVIFGGEALDLASLGEWIAHHGHRRPRLVNMYGITETTVHVTWRPIEPDDLERPGASPVGVPIPDLSLHLLDPRLEPVPVGVAGEMCVGGAGLARGYLGRPGLTAGRFVPHPFSPHPGARLYRSGDLARRRIGGDVEYLGRLDHQVKIRGFRIELGEIEAALQELPEVAETVVVARGGGPAEEASADHRLVAYLVPRHRSGASRLEAADLRRALAKRLPEHMVPAAFVTLDALPLSPTGKVDRRALPEPEPAGAATVADGAPRTPAEELVAGLWEQVLGVERVGVEDDFFHLGGHSLLATRLLSRLRDATGAEIPLADLFEAPTVAALTRRIEARLRKAADPEEAGVAGIPRRGDDGAAPLSFAQERLWFLDRLTPGGAAYNVARALRLDGPLDVAALARALAQVARRHQVLRSRIEQGVDGPVQVADAPTPALPVVDLRRLPGHAPALALCRAESRRSFDLARGPLMRAALLRLDGSSSSPDQAAGHVLLLTFHHIAFDGWSMEILYRELGEAYRRLAGGRRADPTPLPVQYADFALWQRRRLTGERLERLLEFWRDRLAGAPAAFELPADRPRPRVQSERGAREARPLAPSIHAAVAELAAERGATPFVVHLAAFTALLHRYTGRTDVVLGTPMANRTRTEVEALIGFFANTLVLRLDAGGDPSFAELVARVREAVLAAHAHQEVPFEKLVDELAPERDRSRAALFQIMFQVEDERPDALELPGVSARRLDVARVEAKFDLNVALSPGPRGLVAWAQYSSDLFDATRMRRLLGHLEHLLADAVESPEAPLAGLALLGKAERLQVLREWNDTAVPYPRESSIPELFWAQARRRPEATALRQGERWWSYGELARRAERVAARLAAAGVGPEVLVGLAAERSPELVAGLLGILRAGGAYLPLDPDYPAERLAFMLEDGRVPVLLASDAVGDRLPGAGTGSGPRVLSLEATVHEEGPGGGWPRGEPPIRRSGPRSLAYTVYTSGSTGRPKGVAVEHRSVVRLVRGEGCAGLGGSICADDVFLQLAALPFDASTLEIWGPLLNGARLEIFAPGTPSLAELGRGIEDSRVTTLWLTAGLFHQMVESELPRLSGVRRLVAGGDVLSPPHVDRVRAGLAPGQLLVNGYGPTEGTTFTCCHRMGPAGKGQEPGGPVPVGRPIPSTRVCLVDRTARGLEPAPVGVPGELWLGGDGVARGYLTRPALTAAAFAPDPFDPDGTPGARLYRTGDLARWLPGGSVEFLGRLDGQVKLRGFRIELGEIEAALATHPQVERAVAVVREDRPGDRRIVGYAVASGAGEPEPAVLRAHLARCLPEHMVPAACVLLPELPLDPNGKVDRRSLPAPGAGASPPRSRVAPRSPMEELVAEAWSEVLGVEEVGVQDDFFDLGGHSLLATRLVSRLADLTGVELPLARLFDGPTIAELAAGLDEISRGAASPRMEAVTRRPDPDAPVPASFAQERLWFLERLDPGTAAYNIPAVFRFRGSLQPPLLARALREVVRRHEALRTVFAVADGQPVQRIRRKTPPRWTALPWIDLAALPAEAAETEAARVAHRCARQVFDLSAGPLFSAWLVRVSEREHRLAWCVHHVAADGWSMGIVLRELTALYDAWNRGRPAPLGEPPVQYADFAVWQRRTLRDAALTEQLAYWRRQLAGAPRELGLPTDRPRPPVQSFRGGRVRRVVAPGLHERLRALAAGEGATLFMLLLAAFTAVLSRWSGQRDLLVGSPVAGRSRSEIEDLVGMFLNTLVLRLELSSAGDQAPTFRELLRRARATALGAYTHQDVQFEMLLETLEVERDLSRTPLFQVFLNVIDFPLEPAPLEGLSVEVLEGEGQVESKFDLTLYAGPTAAGLSFALVYNAELFDRPRMEELLDQLHGLLAQAAEDPERPFTGYDLRTPSAAAVLPDPRAMLSDRWEGTVDDVFRARAAESPDRVAVVGDDATWSYGALDRAAAGLARELAEAGVVRGDRAAIFAQRSPELAVAVLGVLRAGAAFALLDPAHPPRHLVAIVERSRPRAVVRLRSAGPVPEALEEALARLEPALDLELSALERGAASESHPERSPAPTLGPDDLACVAFTSGSTGEPKGIAGRHGPLSHFIPWQTEHLELRPDDRYSMLSGLTHDPLQRDLFTPLQTGATLCVPPPDDLLRPAKLWAWMERERVSVANLTPAMGQLLKGGADESGGTGELPALRRAFFIGEQLSPRLTDGLERRAPRLVCFNLYGTTETQRALACFRVPRDAARRLRTTVPLGRGFQGVQLLVLGSGDRPAGVAELGEIAVRSPHLARGYLDDPALTAARFTPDPCASSGGRIYRTGDLGRYRPDGAVEFGLRADDQVQVRGFRVELGAIEIALAEHPAVAEAAVAVRSGPDGGTLVGYVVPAAGAPAPPAEELRTHLAKRLPAYMIPGAFVPLEALPLGPTYKLDRRALPDPGSVQVAGGFEPTDSPVEDLLAGVWEDVLRKERVGANDDFFALGGHSLLATRVVSRLRAEIGLELPLRTLFERPRLRDLAAAVEDLLLAEEDAVASRRP